MAKLLRFIGVVTIICGLIVGSLYGNSNAVLERLIGGYKGEFQWSVAFAWWISGAIAGILFFAIAMMLDKMDQLHYQLNALSRSTSSNENPISTSNTKLGTEAAKGYKMRSLD